MLQRQNAQAWVPHVRTVGHGVFTQAHKTRTGISRQRTQKDMYLVFASAFLVVILEEDLLFFAPV